MYKTLEELADAEEICNYCQADPNTNYCDPSCGYNGCEGSWCKEAYENYLDDMGISENTIKIKNKTTVKIERN